MKEQVKMLKIEQQPTFKIDLAKGIVKFGRNNDFPQKVIEAITESPTALSFLNTYKRFLQGNGINDTTQAFKNVGIEDGQPVYFDTFNEKLCQDLTWFDGISIRVIYNALGEPIRYNHLNFDETRLGIPDKMGKVSAIYHNPYWTGRDYKEENTMMFYPYNPDPVVIQKQMEHAESQGKEYYGQCFYAIMEKPGYRAYPIPYWYPAIKTFITDAGISEFHKNNVENNFMLSTIMNIIGDETAPVVNANGDETGTQGELVKRKLKEIQGVQTGGGIFINWALTQENFAKFEPFPNNANDQTFIALQNLIVEKIAYATMVPPILAGVQTPGKLGASNEIANSVILLNQKTQEHRMFLERVYRQLLGKMFPGTIAPKLEPFNPKDFYEAVASATTQTRF